MLRSRYMTMSEIDDATTPWRIKNRSIDTAEKILERNPAFESVANVIDYALTTLKRMQEKK